MAKYPGEKTEQICLDVNESPYENKIYLTDSKGTHIEPVAINRYLKLDELSRFLELLSGYTGVRPEWLFLGNGLDDILFRFMLLLRGKKVVVFEPCFSWYEIFARKAGVNVYRLPLNQAFEIDESAFDSIAAINPDAVIICSPNNPTGNCVNQSILRGLLEQFSEAHFLIDEAYAEFSNSRWWNPNTFHEYRNLCVLRTFSKAWGMANLRLGYCITASTLGPKLGNLELPYHFNSLVLKIAANAIENPNDLSVQKTKQQREWLCQALTDISFLTAYPSEANFLWCKVKVDVPVKLLLADAGIEVRSFDNVPGFVRIGIGTSSENEYLISVLKDADHVYGSSNTQQNSSNIANDQAG